MKQTAVQWLIDQVNTAKWKFADKTDREAIIQQAKEMEKEQMQDLFKAGINYGSGYVIATEWGEETTEPDFQNYYNRTFKSE
jgi:hypothetical protein